jgi:hypothetical protein
VLKKFEASGTEQIFVIQFRGCERHDRPEELAFDQMAVVEVVIESQAGA